MQYSRLKIWVGGILLALCGVIMVACGGGGNGDAGGGVGSVAVLFTDGPADEFDEVNVTVIKTELLGDDGRVTLFEGEETFNLLELTDARLFAIRSDVPSGHYEKIRLTLKHLALVNRDDAGNITEMHEPKLPGNGKLDLVPRADINVGAGETLVVQIDMDANKSIHIVGTGSGKYQFRPVVFVDVISEDFLGKFIQLHGVIDGINTADREFLVCKTDIPVRFGNDIDDDSNRGCIQVAVDDNTSIFAANGLPVMFDKLVEGDSATVYGRLQRDGDVDDDSAAMRELDDMVLLAMTIELGDSDGFQKLDGVAQSDVDSDGRFSFLLDNGQGFVDGSEVSVQLQDGVRVINRRGDILNIDAIAPGVAMKVNGVFDLAADPDQLNASLVIIDSDAGGPTALSGTVGANPDGVCGLTLMTDGGDRSIRVDADTRVFLVTATALLGSSERVEAADLTSGLAADVYGSEGLDGCFTADAIIGYQLTP